MNHNTRSEKSPPLRVSDLLQVGADHAIRKSELCEMLGVDDRKLRQMIQSERLSGAQILSSAETAGYYKPEHSGETIRFIKSMRHRAAETSAVADAVEHSLMIEAGQSRLDGV